MGAEQGFAKLLEIVARLRDPKGGCPWDCEQTHESLRPFLIEECYEFLEALDSGSERVPEELGDVLLQVLLHAQIASEQKAYDIETVMNQLADKLIRRHPHVFGEETCTSSAEVLRNWQKIKKAEYQERRSRLDGVPKSLPALHYAQELGQRAARVGFDWKDAGDVKAKVQEELNEFLEQPQGSAAGEAEFGDLLFSLAQLARKLGIDSEMALRGACAKFYRRFNHLECEAGDDLERLPAGELERIWQRVKLKE